MINKSLIAFIALLFGSIGHQHLTSIQERFLHAESGYIHAQFELAYSYWQQGKKTSAYYWWERAANSGSVKSINRLMTHFPQNSDKWLRLAANAGISSAIDEVAKRQLVSSSFSLKRWVARWQHEQTAWLEKQFDALNSFENNPQCKTTLAVIGHSNSQKSGYLKVLRALEESAFEVNWCAQWLVDSELECTLQGERERASCSATESADYEIIFAESGIASASDRQIVLTEHSSRAVILHEVAHWLGLADEYPMSEVLAQSFCQGLYLHKSLNIVVTDASNNKLYESDIKALYERLPWKSSLDSWRDIAQHNGHYWVLGSDKKQHDIGLFKADTCNAERQFQAWKPVKETTAMEQHATEYWPEIYLQLIESQSETAN